MKRCPEITERDTVSHFNLFVVFMLGEHLDSWTSGVFFFQCINSYLHIGNDINFLGHLVEEEEEDNKCVNGDGDDDDDDDDDEGKNDMNDIDDDESVNGDGSDDQSCSAFTGAWPCHLRKEP